KHYGSRDKLALAIAAALRDEIQALEAAGAEHIQVNDPMIVRSKDDVRTISRTLNTMLDGVSAETGVYSWFGDAKGLLPALLDTPASVIGLDFVQGLDNWKAQKYARFEKRLGLGIVNGRNTRLVT